MQPLSPSALLVKSNICMFSRNMNKNWMRSSVAVMRETASGNFNPTGSSSSSVSLLYVIMDFTVTALVALDRFAGFDLVSCLSWKSSTDSSPVAISCILGPPWPLQGVDAALL